jgi:hypothetical protein
MQYVRYHRGGEDVGAMVGLSDGVVDLVVCEGGTGMDQAALSCRLGLPGGHEVVNFVVG